jgi:UDP-N-acetylmuramate--alanine ligase
MSQISHNIENKKMKIAVIGAAGAGVSNVANIYNEQGYTVLGIDKIKNAATENLERHGIRVYLQDEPNVLSGVDLIFRSAAVKDDNPLIIEAKQKGIEVISRYEFFKEISNTRKVIAIAGSSGKTSTTGITAHILIGDRDCGHLVGIHGNGGHNGTVLDFVLEADEYAKTFLKLDRTYISIITGLKYDHVDIYNTQEEYNNCFREFASKAEILILNGDDQYLIDTMSDFKFTTYGLNQNNDWCATDIKNHEGGSTFKVFNNNKLIANITLNVIGGHNVMNALAGFVANYLNNVPVNTIISQLSNFKGLPRRLEQLRSEPFFVYDDYAHLPNEIATVLKGVRDSYPYRRIICYFQGHTYTRINAFFDDYTKALSNCDVLLLGDVYAARDAEGSVDLAKLINLVDVPNKQLSGTVDNTIELIKDIVKDGDVLLCLNAGDGTKVAHYFKNY